MKQKGPALKAAFEARIAEHLKVLASSSNKEMNAVAKELVAQAPDAEKAYSQTNCAAMAAIFDGMVAKKPELATDDQLMQVVTGSVYAYSKYLNARGKDYEAAGDAAREKGLGLWTEKGFKALWEVNARNSRYHPEDCLKQ